MVSQEHVHRRKQSYCASTSPGAAEEKPVLTGLLTAQALKTPGAFTATAWQSGLMLLAVSWKTAGAHCCRYSLFALR